VVKMAPPKIGLMDLYDVTNPKSVVQFAISKPQIILREKREVDSPWKSQRKERLDKILKSVRNEDASEIRAAALALSSISTTALDQFYGLIEKCLPGDAVDKSGSYSRYNQMMQVIPDISSNTGTIARSAVRLSERPRIELEEVISFLSSFEPDVASRIAGSLAKSSCVSDLISIYREAGELMEDEELCFYLTNDPQMTPLLVQVYSSEDFSKKCTRGMASVIYHLAEIDMELCEQFLKLPELGPGICRNIGTITQRTKSAEIMYRTFYVMSAMDSLLLEIFASAAATMALDQELLEDYLSLIEAGNEMVIKGIIRTLAHTDMNLQSKLITVREYLPVVRGLTTDEVVLLEFAEYIGRNEPEGMGQLVKEESPFLNAQEPSTIFPLAVIMYENQEYVDQIKQFSEGRMFPTHLTQAWDIARRNDFPMDEFYATLQQALDEGTADRWAKEIVDGYRQKGEQGLLRWVG